jgi:predicted phosphodiesterase
MRIAAIYDIHGNLPALEAVLDEVARAGVDQIVVGGDVFPGPMPRETLACLLESRITMQFIHGNGDREVLAQMNGIETDWYRTVPEPWRELIRWTAEQLDPNHRQIIASWPSTLRRSMPEFGDVLFCHATPRNDTDIFTRETAVEKLLPMFRGVEAALVVCGHSHMKFDRMVGSARVVNAGSVGMPFGQTGADWLVLDSAVRLQHTDYDLERAAERIRATPYPQAEEFANRHVLNSPSEQEILDGYARAEVK